MQMYNMTIPPLRRALGVMDFYMDKGAEFVSALGLSDTYLVEARLAPDMLPLAGQVQRLSDNVRAGVARLVAGTVPVMPDTEQTFGELKSRITATLAYVDTVSIDEFIFAHERSVTLAFRSVSRTMTGLEYLHEYLLPNVYFHLSTAHGILRSKGLPIGKRDYFGESTRVSSVQT